MNIEAIIKGKFLYTTKELSEMLEVTPHTIRLWRKQTTNPLRFSKIGGTALYTRTHIIDYIVNNITGLSNSERQKLKQELEAQHEDL